MSAHAASRSRHRAVIFVVLAAVVVIALVTGAFFVVQGMRSAAQAEFDAAMRQFETSQAESRERITSAETAIDAAAEVLAASEGKVLTEDSRTALTAALESARATVASSSDQLADRAEDAEASASSDPGFLDTGSALREGAVSLASYSADTDGSVDAVEADLAPHVDAVTAAVAAWQAEQERIIASRYTNHVHAAGWTAELDQCKGSVDLSARYGTAAIAEHWSCGGKNFPDEPGTIIQLTGVREGTYRVEGIVKMLNQRVATIADVPTGYDLIYQTCQNGQPSTMSMTALTKIG